ncbi:MAG: head-tail adaptor protein [Burkholderiales bacterium]
MTIEQKSVTVDSTYGTELVTWIPLVRDGVGSPIIAVRFWAEVQDALPSRDERLTQGAVIASKRTRIRMRWRDDIDSSMRVTIHGDSDEVYQIISPAAEIEGRKNMIEFMCEWVSS